MLQSSTISTFVYKAKPSFPSTQELVKVTEGSTAVLNCDVRGSPFPNIVWSPSESSLDSRHHVNGTKVTINNVTTGDSSIYNCIATNALGSASKQIVFQVFSTYVKYNKQLG